MRQKRSTLLLSLLVCQCVLFSVLVFGESEETEDGKFDKGTPIVWARLDVCDGSLVDRESRNDLRRLSLDLLRCFTIN